MEANPDLEKQIKKNALNSGLLLGGISSVLGIICYYVIISASSIWTILFAAIFIVFVPFIVLAVIISKDMRKKIGGFWNFRQATSGIFIMFFVSFLVSTIFTKVIFEKLIEPDMTEKTQAATLNATIGMMEKSGAEQEKIDAKTAELQKGFDKEKNASIGKKALGVGGNIIFLFVLSLIFGAIFKKEKPIFDLIDESPDA